MNSIAVSSNNLPGTLEDLSKFVLVGREQLVAVRAAIRAIDKVGVAQEVRKQKLKEGQEIAEAVLDAEVRIGELMREVPKASGGAPYHKDTVDSGVQSTKAKIIEDAGFTVKQVQRFETLAAHPEAVERAKAEARENQEMVTRSSVLEKVASEKEKPHVTFNSGNNEWYTPEKYIEMARAVLGEIELDPASSETANKTVKADCFYTEQDDGLSKQWRGKVWMNPPYGTDLIGKFTEKFADEYTAGSITEGIVLVNNATETAWFSYLVEAAAAVVFPHGRIKYYSPTKESNAPLQGQAFVYFGLNPEKFLEVFGGGRLGSVGPCVSVGPTQTRTEGGSSYGLTRCASLTTSHRQTLMGLLISKGKFSSISR
jgi:ParB family chromosome partitioning protein